MSTVNCLPPLSLLSALPLFFPMKRGPEAVSLLPENNFLTLAPANFLMAFFFSLLNDTVSLHCERHLWVSSAKLAHRNPSGSVPQIYHVKSRGFRQISHSQMNHSQFDLAPIPPPPL